MGLDTVFVGVGVILHQFVTIAITQSPQRPDAVHYSCAGSLEFALKVETEALI
jgi:hypothetical protein